jgi:hypothetical protein
MRIQHKKLAIAGEKNRIGAGTGSHPAGIGKKFGFGWPFHTGKHAMQIGERIAGGEDAAVPRVLE